MRQPSTRRHLTFPLVFGFLLAACGGTAAPASSSGAPASPAASLAAPAKPSTATGTETLDSIQPLPQKVPVRVTMSASAVYPLPIYLGVQKGWFDKANLDIQLTLAKDPSTILPGLADNQIDISDMVALPGLYNQVAQGFDAKLMASLSVAKQGRAPSYYLVVEKDEADQIKTLQDLKGKTIEGLFEGSPADLMANIAVQQSGLPAGAVTISHRVKSPADLLGVAKSHAADVIATPNTIATAMEQQGYAVKWKADAEIMPFYAIYLAAAGPFVTQQPAAVQKFLEVYLLASRQVNASNGEWDPALLQLASDKSGNAADTLKALGPLLYFDPNGAIPNGGLDKIQQVFAQEGLVKQPVDTQGLQNTAPLQAALQKVGTAQ